MSFKPNKKASSKDSVKNDIAEKVKEIKARQQNWMKQRDNHLSNTVDKEASRSYSTLSSGRVSKNNASTSVSQNGSSQHSRDSKTIEMDKSNKSKGGKPVNNNTRPENHSKNARIRFQDWMHAREATLTTDDQETDERIQGTISDTRHTVAQANKDHTNSYSRNGLESGRRAELSPDLFDELADQIVSRVKREMNLDDAQKDRSTRTEKANGQDVQSKEAYLESHYCPMCSKLMLPPSHSPMMIIPCGHTFCEKCSSGLQMCVHCHCDIQSVTCNIMLQQIISQHSQRQTSNPRSHKHTSNGHYQAGNYSEGVDYREEYRNLSTRCEVLNAEAAVISDNLHNISEQMERNTEHIRGIDGEEQKIHEQLRHLEEKLENLTRHKEACRQKHEELENRQFEESNRLALVQETLESLHQQIDKVKFLAER